MSSICAPASPARPKSNIWADRALLALQGPQAAEVLGRFVPAAETMKFMSVLEANFRGVPVLITRSGYTGEDGYEISVPNACADITARLLLAEEEVEAIGLGARDSLRLEAGLCLYGHDIDTTTTPVEANLNWVIGKRRRAEGGFPGADIILDQLANGTARKRVGIRPDGRAPAREHTPVTDASGARLGRGDQRRLRPQRQRPGRHGLRRDSGGGARHAGQPRGPRQADAGQGGRNALRAPALLPGLTLFPGTAFRPFLLFPLQIFRFSDPGYPP